MNLTRRTNKKIKYLNFLHNQAENFSEYVLAHNPRAIERCLHHEEVYQAKSTSKIFTCGKITQMWLHSYTHCHQSITMKFMREEKLFYEYKGNQTHHEMLHTLVSSFKWDRKKFFTSDTLHTHLLFMEDIIKQLFMCSLQPTWRICLPGALKQGMIT